jgi:hypothetical protein
MARRRRNQRRQYALTQRDAKYEAEQHKHQGVQAEDRHEYSNNELDQIGTRRAERADKKCEWYGVQQHHAIEDRRFLRREIAAPSSQETEQQGDDDRSECAQNGRYHNSGFAADVSLGLHPFPVYLLGYAVKM